jgi:hypothetical protein
MSLVRRVGRLCMAPLCMAPRFLLLAPLGAGCSSAEEGATGSEGEPTESVRGNRYCEVLVAFVEGDSVEAEVWGTQGLNDCPQAAWESIDPMAIRAEAGATTVVLDGPRYWVLDGVSAELPEGAPRRFGTLEMRQLASVTLPLGTTSSMAYVERTIRRNSEFEFLTGSEIYELIAADGSAYVMQSYAQIVDPSLSESDLPGLGAGLSLPSGWQYRVRTLEAPLVVSTPGEATVLQDELSNTYSRYVDGG